MGCLFSEIYFKEWKYEITQISLQCVLLFNDHLILFLITSENACKNYQTVAAYCVTSEPIKSIIF